MEQEALMEQTRGAVTEQAPGVAVDDVSERVRQQKIKHNQQKHVRHPVFGILLASFLISNHSLVHVLQKISFICIMRSPGVILQVAGLCK